jgi:hypothetical protein
MRRWVQLYPLREQGADHFRALDRLAAAWKGFSLSLDKLYNLYLPAESPLIKKRCDLSDERNRLFGPVKNDLISLSSRSSSGRVR